MLLSCENLRSEFSISLTASLILINLWNRQWDLAPHVTVFLAQLLIQRVFFSMTQFCVDRLNTVPCLLSFYCQSEGLDSFVYRFITEHWILVYARSCRGSIAMALVPSDVTCSIWLEQLPLDLCLSQLLQRIYCSCPVRLMSPEARPAKITRYLVGFICSLL